MKQNENIESERQRYYESMTDVNEDREQEYADMTDEEWAEVVAESKKHTFEEWVAECDKRKVVAK